MSARKICQFFLNNGYCTLGNECKLYHTRNMTTKIDSCEDNIIEIAFSFDTTGSMKGYLFEICKQLRVIIQDLFSKIKNIRISIIVHKDYVVKYIDFTRDENKLIQFVNNARETNGDDDDDDNDNDNACYELCLWYAAHKLNWTKNAKSKALVIIGDSLPYPHTSNDKNIDWRKEVEILRKQSCTIYAVYCGNMEINKYFYKEISKCTNGKYLHLSNINNMVQLFIALCLTINDNKELFDKYKHEILKTRQSNDELFQAIITLSIANKPQTLVNKSSMKRLMNDLKEIKRENLSNISVAPDDKNVYKWHINMQPIQGMFKTVYIHLTLTFPINYPYSPPQIDLISPIPNNIHPNIINNSFCLIDNNWKAAYSISGLLINILSVFNQIEVQTTVNAKRKSRSRRRKKGGTNTFKISLLDTIRKTNCNQCGHSYQTPFPVLKNNELLFDIIECDVNKYCEWERTACKTRKRNVIISGNIINTHGEFCKIKAIQTIQRTYHKTVCWQFIIDTIYVDFDYIFGFVDENDMFFGINVDGNIIYHNNKLNNYSVYTNNDKIKVHDTITYILHLGNNTIYIFVNSQQIGCVSLPKLYAKCNIFYVVMYLKDIRVRLKNDNHHKVYEIIKNNKYPFDEINVFNKLSKMKRSDQIFSIHKTQNEWNALLAKTFIADILLPIFEYLSYSDLLHCHNVNVFWNKILIEYHMIEREEIKCFYTKQSIKCNNNNNSLILGVGLNVIHTVHISTAMDYLSLAAYNDCNINKGAFGQRITHFLPLIINENHSERAMMELLDRLCLLTQDNTFNVKNSLIIIQNIMNQFVLQLVSAMDNPNNVKLASDKALIGYCAFHHMLLFLARKYPKMKEIAKQTIAQFINEESYRYENNVETKDLGIWLLNLSIIDDEYTWHDISNIYINESLDRDVKWYIEKYPDLEYLDERKCSMQDRLKMTLQSTTVSRRLSQLQVWFVNNICKRKTLEMYNKRCGQAIKQEKYKLLKYCTGLLHEKDDINAWLSYFNRVGIHKYMTNIDVCNRLKEAVRNGRNKGYYFFDDNKLNFKPTTNLMVNYLPCGMTEKELYFLFSCYGKIKRHKIIYDKNTGISRCFGFVEYFDAWHADEALAEINGYQICGKKLKVSAASVYKQNNYNDFENDCNLYIQHIPLYYQDSDLQKLFIKFGQILDYTILRNDNGDSRGVGFVRFNRKQNAIIAMKTMNGKHVDIQNENEPCLPPLFVKFAHSNKSHNSQKSHRNNKEVETTPSTSTVLTVPNDNININNSNSNSYNVSQYSPPMQISIQPQIQFLPQPQSIYLLNNNYNNYNVTPIQYNNPIANININNMNTMNTNIINANMNANNNNNNNNNNTPWIITNNTITGNNGYYLFPYTK